MHLDAKGREVPAMSLRVGEHAEVRALTSYAWRVRSHSGSLLLEMARTPSPPEPVEGSSPADADVVTIHVRPCG